MDQEWELLLGGCTLLVAEGLGEEAGDDGSGGDGGGDGDGGGAVRMSGVPAGKACAACGGSVVVAVVVAVVVDAVAVVAAVGRHPEIGSLVGGCNRHDKR
jgi:hypothetical protein